MAYIGLKNFRRFESLETLKLNNINIFVGKNNAGKSTVVKAIMLVLDNLRELRWDHIPTQEGFHASQHLPRPLFRFDADGFYNLHVGTFNRALCNHTEDKYITFDLEYKDVGFEITVASTTGDEQSSAPIQRLKITFLNKMEYKLNFKDNTMAIKIIREKEIADTSDDDSNNNSKELAKNIKKNLAIALEQNDALRIAELNEEYERVKRTSKKKAESSTSIKTSFDDNPQVWDLTYFHEHTGNSILVQYLHTFLKISENNDYSSENFEPKAMLSHPEKFKKNSEKYRKQYENRLFIAEHKGLIEKCSRTLESVLNHIHVDYIQAHAATQKLILTTDDRQDINSKVVHAYYQERIHPGEKANLFLNKWLKKFEIANGITITPLDGEGYYVKVDTDHKLVHLADMGMGSIQLVILLLRLATIGHRVLSSGQTWWVIIEEPEQNMHPMLQSMLAEMFKDFQDTFQSMLIVETHSEYMIRKTQLLMANEDYQENEDLSTWPFSIFYFPSQTDKQPYDMRYQHTGLFENRFDSGFFDEAGRMHMEILKRSRDKKKG